MAKLYGVATKRLNEQVKRNKKRFPEDFMFQLTKEEKDELVAICDRLERLKHSSVATRLRYYVDVSPEDLEEAESLTQR